MEAPSWRAPGPVAPQRVYLVPQVSGHAAQRQVVGEGLLCVDPGHAQPCHHGRCEACQPGLGLLPEHQGRGLHPDLHVVLLVLQGPEDRPEQTRSEGGPEWWTLSFQLSSSFRMVNTMLCT